jgi:MFS family permease
MHRPMESAESPAGPLRAIRPLFAAGFVTAFGAHSIAANLGFSSPDLASHLLALGVLLALYDGAEVLLKPVFGSLADRIGPRPVLLGGLLGFAAASAAFVVAGNPAGLGLARFTQGAAAAAFSPVAGALIARIAPDWRRGRAFGSYGAWKGLGYTLGPALGGALISLGGYRCCSWSSPLSRRRWRWPAGRHSPSPACPHCPEPARPCSPKSGGNSATPAAPCSSGCWPPSSASLPASSASQRCLSSPLGWVAFTRPRLRHPY